jgi:hypothetical protein
LIAAVERIPHCTSDSIVSFLLISYSNNKMGWRTMEAQFVYVAR